MNVTAIRGDSQTYDLDFVDANGDPIDLTDCDIWFTVEDLFEKRLGTGITSASPLTGVATVTVDPADTEDCPDYRVRYRYDAQLELIDGSIKTPIRGWFTVLPDVTT
jgi:hypothetical protein